MDTNYSVIVTSDGQREWAEIYDNALDAVNAYNKFVDYGTSASERIIILVEPTGKFHNKIFKRPVVLGLK